MKAVHENVKNRSFEKTFPGCLGRMVNLFDLNAGMNRNMLLTDKPHREGSPLSRTRSDVTNTRPSGDPVEDNEIGSPLRSTNATPMKMLIAREMSKEVESKHSPPNVVAKLMGLDALPQQGPDSATVRKHHRGHHRSHSDTPMGYWEQQDRFDQYVDPSNYKDIYEVWYQQEKANLVRDKSRLKGRHDETTNGKKMAFVRQKFDEAKRLSMDEKLRQSKQFQDALEVLNSNKDLFLKCLQEPSSVFSQHSTAAPETKRITVLRPSKMVDGISFAGNGNKDGTQMTKHALVGQLDRLEKDHLRCSPPANWKADEHPTQPTRIVVLKPSPGKQHDFKAFGSPQSQSPRKLRGEDFLRNAPDENNLESRYVAKAITQEIREKLGRHRRDETLLSSVFSNRYVGDESSSYKSEIEYADSNLSDSEIVSPISRHSWDCGNRFGSPYSSSSFGRASYSPDSSVGREAKKRLSERWEKMASRHIQEQRQVRRNSSTLGEMLSLSETKKARLPEEKGNTNEESSKFILECEQKKDENADNSPRNLLRSKSLPVSSTEFGRQDADFADTDGAKHDAPKEATKAKNGKLSFKGKVSSLFFSRNKKSAKDKSSSSESRDESHSGGMYVGHISQRKTELSHKGSEHLSSDPQGGSSKLSSPNFIGEQDLISSETGLCVTKPVLSANATENQDQPSPISVLDQPFDEDERVASVSSCYIKPERNGPEQILNHPIAPNLIGKSPPIGSIARTLSSDDPCAVTASSYPLQPSLRTQGAEEEHDWFSLVQTLISITGLDDEMQSEMSFIRWHSSESPLDPSLRDSYIDLKEKETLHEAKRRQKRSTRKLVFDCVNAALADITGYGSDYSLKDIASINNASLSVADQVWARMKILFSGEVRQLSTIYGEENSMVVEEVVRKEVVGKGWADHLRLERDQFGEEIEGMLLDELVHEAVAQLTCRP